jgi:hypothetical protein
MFCHFAKDFSFCFYLSVYCFTLAIDKTKCLIPMNFPKAPWAALRKIAADTTAPQEIRTAAALSLCALYEYIEETTELVVKVPAPPPEIDQMDNEKMSIDKIDGAIDC